MLVLLPQAITAMMPAIVSQLVVLLKDTALGYIIAYDDLLNMGFKIIPRNYGNLIPAAIVIAVIYIAINMALGALATWLEKRSRRSRKTSARPIAPPGRSSAPAVPPWRSTEVCSAVSPSISRLPIIRRHSGRRETAPEGRTETRAQGSRSHRAPAHLRICDPSHAMTVFIAFFSAPDTRSASREDTADTG